jgi:large subunit ribosomal protein L3
MALEMMGRKLGMTQIFDDTGNRIPVTILATGPCTVVQKKTLDRDGYAALQLGFDERRPERTTKPLAGHFARAETSPKRFLYEVRVSTADLEGYEVGQQVDCSGYEAGQIVDVSGTSKGRGFTGVIKRWGFSKSKRTHGTHEFFRHGGAISAGAYPGKVFRGKKMPGQHGNARITTEGLRVERVDAERNLVFVRGAVPGHSGGVVRVRPSIRKQKA